MLQRKLASIEEWRSKSKPLPKGSAPFTSASNFKLPHPVGKPNSRDLSHLFSNESRSRQSSTLKAAAATALSREDMITLGTARPSPEYFPWTSLILYGGGDTTFCGVNEEAYDLSIAMNYGYAAGSPQLLRYVTEHVELVHDPPYADWETCLTCGTSSALDILLRIFCDRSDWVIAEEYTYSGAKDVITAHGLRVLGIGMDDCGLVPDELDRKLKEWDANLGRKPFLLYMIPTGHNPTGITQPLERRNKIYEVAERHDLYIIEDDPYYYLQLGSTSMTPKHPTPNASTAEEYLARLPQSYLSIDTSGRVVRLDSTAKIVAPGLRLGWLTASPQTVQRFLAYSELSVLAPSGPSQIMAFKLLEESWGHRGFIDWLFHLSGEYSRRRDSLRAACERHLPSKVCQWKTPSAGMFLWIRLNNVKNPEAKVLECGDDQSLTSLLDMEDRIYTGARELGVLISKGTWFASNSDRTGDLCFRLTFAAAAHGDLEVAVERFAKAVNA
ncbi:PLP-dependent transferase, partial [Karstenula rhodostoma CBS 690.94]